MTGFVSTSLTFDIRPVERPGNAAAFAVCVSGTDTVGHAVDRLVLCEMPSLELAQILRDRIVETVEQQFGGAPPVRKQ